MLHYVPYHILQEPQYTQNWLYLIEYKDLPPLILQNLHHGTLHTFEEQEQFTPRAPALLMAHIVVCILLTGSGGLTFTTKHHYIRD